LHRENIHIPANARRAINEASDAWKNGLPCPGCGMMGHALWQGFAKSKGDIYASAESGERRKAFSDLVRNSEGEYREYYQSLSRNFKDLKYSTNEADSTEGKAEVTEEPQAKKEKITPDQKLPGKRQKPPKTPSRALCWIIGKLPSLRVKKGEKTKQIEIKNITSPHQFNSSVLST
jgi:hypothetical protein